MSLREPTTPEAFTYRALLLSNNFLPFMSQLKMGFTYFSKIILESPDK